MAEAGTTRPRAGDAAIQRLIDNAEKKSRDDVDAITHRLNDLCKLTRDYIDRISSVQTESSDKATKGSENNLFPLLKEAETLIAECKTSTSGIQHKCDVKSCVLVENKTLLNHLQSVGVITFHYLSDDINIRGPTDGSTCHVTGLLVLADGRLLLSDYNNKKIKLFNDNHKLVSHVPLQYTPSDIAETAGGQVAVCLPDNKAIQLLWLSLSGTLTTGQVIHTAVKCWSVTRCGENLAAVHHTSRDIVEINMRGRKVTTVWTCPHGVLLYIRHNTRGELITTDYGPGVTRVTRDGVVLARYKGDNLADPRGLTVHPDGSIYVCGCMSDNIHHIAADCTRIKVFGKGRVSRPWVASYNQHNNSLYVSQTGQLSEGGFSGHDCIKVFRIGY